MFEHMLSGSRNVKLDMHFHPFYVIPMVRDS